MRYFYPVLIVIASIAVLTVLFLALSLNTNGRITFTDGEEIDQPTITVVDPSRGAADAKVSVVVFSDYDCLACRQYESTLKSLAQAFPNDVRIIYKDMPNSSSHPEALPAAIAAQCAGKQKKFWEFHDALMSGGTLSRDGYIALAKSLDLRESAFTKCIDDKETLPLVERSFSEGASLNITGTPTTFIGEERWTGMVDLATLTRVVQQKLR